MNGRLSFFFIRLVAVAVVLFAGPARADEGMWTYDNIPLEQLQKKYGFTPTKPWLEHLMKASVRFNNGGSGSFISADGLVLTNHHVAVDTLQKISDEQHNYVSSGYYSGGTLAREIPARDLELNVLQGIEDVTARVNGVIQPGMSAAEQTEARQAEIGRIEKEWEAKTGLRSNVVTLYQGGQYHLYLYKQYKDVRLVFAPEKAIAFFGGDPDNFTFPRYDLDMAVFRVYENGKPAKIDHHLKWSVQGPKEGDLTFVSGHPGSTSRMLTLNTFEYLRDFSVPYNLQRLQAYEQALLAFSRLGPEQARRAESLLFGIQNSRKVYVGRDQGLKEGKVVAEKARQEAELRRAVAAHPELQPYAGAWDAIVATRARARQLAMPYNLLEAGHGLTSTLFGFARNLVRLAEENAKPDDKRLPEFKESRKKELLDKLFADVPIYADLEEAKTLYGLQFIVARLGAEHELTKLILAGKAPAERAAELVRTSKLFKNTDRKTLAEGGQAALDASTDPMILLAKAVDAASRSLRKQIEAEVDEPEKQAYAQIAKALFAIHGTNRYPDATFTLRLAFGEVKGYHQGKVWVPPTTNIAGAYTHEAAHGAQDPWKLPDSWHREKGSVDLTKSLNFASTADIIGGNSGSPQVNRDGELVGLIFDGNIESLILDYGYEDVVSRAVSVSSDGMLEALTKIYKANALVAEILGASCPAAVVTQTPK